MEHTTKDPREMQERESCPACIGHRLHTKEEWKNHPLAGHGFYKEFGYTDPVLGQSNIDRLKLVTNVLQ